MSYSFMKNITENDNLEIIQQAGPFSVVEQRADTSVFPNDAEVKYYMSQMDVCRRQIMCTLKGNSVNLQPGAMQLMIGDIQQTTGIHGAGDLVKKAFNSKMTGDAAIKPEYKGDGIVLCEPSYRHYIIEDVSKWGKLVCDDGRFVACEGSVKIGTQMRKNVSSALLGNEGLVSPAFSGSGYVVLSCGVHRNELFEVVLDNDVLKIDGNFAVAWSGSLDFTVERSGKTLAGSAASGEGLVNVYRGTGRVLLYPYW